MNSDQVTQLLLQLERIAQELKRLNDKLESHPIEVQLADPSNMWCEVLADAGRGH